MTYVDQLVKAINKLGSVSVVQSVDVQGVQYTPDYVSVILRLEDEPRWQAQVRFILNEVAKIPVLENAVTIATQYLCLKQRPGSPVVKAETITIRGGEAECKQFIDIVNQAATIVGYGAGILRTGPVIDIAPEVSVEPFTPRTVLGPTRR